jgi:hypothetical protein
MLCRRLRYTTGIYERLALGQILRHITTGTSNQ